MKKLFALSLTVVALGLFAIGCEKAPGPVSKPAPKPDATATSATDAAVKTPVADAPKTDADTPAETPKTDEK